MLFPNLGGCLLCSRDYLGLGILIRKYRIRLLLAELPHVHFDYHDPHLCLLSLHWRTHIQVFLHLTAVAQCLCAVNTELSRMEK